jgi:hypothetical protein
MPLPRSILPSKAQQIANGGEGSGELKTNTALIDGVRQIVMDVRELDIDMIDRVNPFDAAYAVLSKALDEKMLKQVAATIAAKRVNSFLRGRSRASRSSSKI